MSDLVVVKVGGSLFDLPDLGSRLRRWLNTAEGVRPPSSVLLVPGGGLTANVIRDMDALHALGDEAAHWLALRALSLNAHFLAHLLPGSPVVANVLPTGPRLRILDAFAFMQADEERHGTTTPHSWEATSDSVAARVAVTTRARRLILLKSVTFRPEESDWGEAARTGHVDSVFASIVGSERGELEVQIVNFRTVLHQDQPRSTSSIREPY